MFNHLELFFYFLLCWRIMFHLLNFLLSMSFIFAWRLVLFMSFLHWSWMNRFLWFSIIIMLLILGWCLVLGSMRLHLFMLLFFFGRCRLHWLLGLHIIICLFNWSLLLWLSFLRLIFFFLCVLRLRSIFHWRCLVLYFFLIIRMHDNWFCCLILAILSFPNVVLRVGSFHGLNFIVILLNWMRAHLGLCLRAAIVKFEISWIFLRRFLMDWLRFGWLNIFIIVIKAYWLLFRGFIELIVIVCFMMFLFFN